MTLPPVPDGFVMHRGPLSYREFAERVKADLRRAMREVTHPEADIPPVAYYHVPLPREAAPSRLFRAELAWDWFQARETKDELVARMATMARALRAAKFAWATTQYMSMVNLDALTPEQQESIDRDELPEGYVQPSEDPNRLEFVGLYVYDAERVEIWTSFITRRPGRPPRYGKWNDHPKHGEVPAEATGLIGGMMHHPLQEALR